MCFLGFSDFRTFFEIAAFPLDLAWVALGCVGLSGGGAGELNYELS